MRALDTRLRTYGVAAGERAELRAHGGAEHPGRVPGALAARFVCEHHGARAVGRRARLEIVDRVPQHRGLLHLLDRDVGELQVGVRVLARVQAVLDGNLPTDVLGRVGLRDVRPDPRGEVPARAETAGSSAGEAPLRVALGLLLVRDRQHPLELPRLHEV